ncbi:MAG: non-heme iron oxygenase ferredoxin subunit [Candidatus Obscuribacterales bacterium]
MTELFQKIACKEDVPAGQSKVFEISGEKIALCNVGGKYYAIADLCSHDDGPLGEGELVGDQIECPRHGARFDLNTGAAMCLPAVMPIPTYTVEVRGEEIWIGARK